MLLAVEGTAEPILQMIPAPLEPPAPEVRMVVVVVVDKVAVAAAGTVPGLQAAPAVPDRMAWWLFDSCPDALVELEG
jgi:hypothetical protein